MTSFVAKAQLGHVARRSVARLRDIVRAGGLTSLATVDKHTGEVADPEARALFASLPAVTPATAPEELVTHGLVPKLPKGLGEIAERARYRVDRYLFVRTSVSHTSSSPRRPVGAFAPEGKVRFTHRAQLKKQRGENFLVELEGAPGLLPFAKTDVFAWNEPCGVPAAGGTISGVQIDFNEARFKAHVCAGFVEIAEALATLDFHAAPEEVQSKQAQLLHRLASLVRMDYAGQGKGYAGARAGSLINGGQGVSFVQRAVAGAYLQAFAKVLGFEVQMAVGRTLRLNVPHGFVVVTTLPSLKRYVCDPAWSEPLTDLAVAFFGAGWGQDRRLVGFEGEQAIIVRPTEIDVPQAEVR